MYVELSYIGYPFYNTCKHNLHTHMLGSECNDVKKKECSFVIIQLSDIFTKRQHILIVK